MQYKNFTVIKDGFAGRLILPDPQARQAVIVLHCGGTRAGIFSGVEVARKFAQNGFAALALKLSGSRDGPASPDEIPVEMISNAVDYLRKIEDMKMICVYGAGIASAAAAMAGVLYSDLDQIVLVAPTHVVFEGIQKNGKGSGNSFLASPLSTIQFLPLGKIDFSRCRSAWESFHAAYKDSMRAHRASIPIERSQASVFIAAGDQDEFWPAAHSAKILEKRLNKAGYPFPVQVNVYHKAGHLIGVLPDHFTLLEKMKVKLHYINERRHPRQCLQGRVRSEKDIMDWIREDI